MSTKLIIINQIKVFIELIIKNQIKVFMIPYISEKSESGLPEGIVLSSDLKGMGEC